MNRKRDALVSELRAHNTTLREQLEAERQGHTETRRLIAAALERVTPQPEAGTRTVQTNQDGEENLFKPSKAAFLSMLRGAARDKAAYDDPLMRVLLPTYLVGFVVVCLVASIGAYAALNPEDPVLERLS